MILERLEVDPAELAARTGWEIKPEGACKADRCVPLPDGPARRGHVLAGRARHGARRRRRDHGLWALGPGVRRARAARARGCPTSSCPTATAGPFSLRSLRGTQVVMVAWASW